MQLQGVRALEASITNHPSSSSQTSPTIAARDRVLGHEPSGLIWQLRGRRGTWTKGSARSRRKRDSKDGYVPHEASWLRGRGFKMSCRTRGGPRACRRQGAGATAHWLTTCKRAREHPVRAEPQSGGSPDPIPNSAVKPRLAESTAAPGRGRTGRSARRGRFSRL